MSIDKKVKKDEIDPTDLNTDADLLGDAPIKGQMNIEYLISRQVLTTGQSATQDESLFSANVRILLSMIPKRRRDDITNRRDEYTSINTHYEYKYNCNVRMGTPEEPILGSPWVVTEEVSDWHTLFQIIMEALEEEGITWKRDNWTVEAKRIKDGKPAPQPTPVLLNTPLPEQPIIPGFTTPPAKTKKQRKCGCGCGEPIAPKTGMFYKNIMILIKHLDRAKLKWANEEHPKRQ